MTHVPARRLGFWMSFMMGFWVFLPGVVVYVVVKLAQSERREGASS